MLCGLYMGKGVTSGVPLFYLFVGAQGHQSILYTFSSDRPLCEGEVGLYSGENYTGQCWISNSYFFEGNGVQDIPSLQTAKVKSIKLGPKAKLSPFYAKMDLYEYNGFLPPEDAYHRTYQLPIVKSVPAFTWYSYRGAGEPFTAYYKLTIDTAAQIKKLLSKAVPLRVLNSMSEDYFHEDGKLVQRDVYRTTLIFNRTQKDNSYDLPSKVKIYSDSTCSEEIEVFGKTYSIDRDTCATVQPNSMGRVIVTQNTIHHTSGQHRLGAPTLLIQTDQMNDTDYIHVHPEYQMARKLKEKGHQQDAWLNAKTPAGKHVVPDKYRNKANCDALQKAMHNMASTALYGTHEDATSTHQHLAFDARMMSDSHWAIGPHPSSLEFGYHVVGKDITAEELDALLREIEVIDLDATPDSAVVHAIEKVVHVIVHAVEDAVHVIINGIINGIKKAVKFIVKVAEDIGRALESVLKAIEVAIEDVIDFLKDIFEWKDISHTSSVLHKTMTDALGPNGVPHYLNNYRSAVNSFIREQKQHVDADIQKLFHNTGKTAQPTASGSESPLMEGIEKLEWFLGKITSLDGIGGNRDLTMDALEKFENATLEIAESFTNLAGDAFADIEKVVANLANHEAPTDAMAPIGTFLEQAVNTVLNDLEIVADDIIDLLIEGLEGTGRVLDESIFQEIIDSIPFIGKLIDFLEKELHFSIGGPSLASSVSLLYAIPVTITSKLISGGHAPFADTDTLWQTSLSQYGKLGVNVVKAIKEFITTITNSKLALQVGAGDEQDTPGVVSLVINTAGMVAGFAGFASTIMFPKENQTAQDVSVADSALAMFESMLPLMMCAYAKWGENSSFDYGKAQVIVNSIAGISKAALSSVLLGVDPHDETFSKIASLADGVSNASQVFALAGEEASLGSVALIIPLNIASGICYGVAALEAIE